MEKVGYYIFVVSYVMIGFVCSFALLNDVNLWLVFFWPIFAFVAILCICFKFTMAIGQSLYLCIH